VTLVTERLAGCTTESLDGYLRGLGFFLLAGEFDPSVRAWWDDDVLWIGSVSGVEELASQVVEKVRRDPPLLRTPWRGSEGRERDFIGVRNEADDLELDWFDACALARPADASGTRSVAGERSDRENNPLLGQGGAFGNSKPQDAYGEAVATIQSEKIDTRQLTTALVAALRGEPSEQRIARRLSTTKAVLGAYQSGRATGAGSSVRDVEPTRQATRSSVWDVVLVLTGLRLFRGGVTRRPDPRARTQASFPFLARSRPIGTGPGGAHDLRTDDPQTYEFLAPLWSSPCTARTLRRLIAAARLRLPYGAARDTLDAVLVQASRCAHGLGFDRLVRFALVAGSDPRYRSAVRRGDVHALGQAAARLAVNEILPFLRGLERAAREEPPSLALARRRLDDALAAFGRRTPDHQQFASEARTQEALIALALLQTPAARAAPDLAAPWSSSAWFRLADDRSAEFRLARSLVAGFSDARASLVRETLLPQRRAESGQFVLDATRTPPELERVADPLAVLVELVLAALRRTEQYDLTRAGSTPLDALAALLSGALGGEGERRLALLAAALAGIHPSGAPPAHEQDPAAHGLGADVARLLLAAQSAEGEDGADTRALERAAALASLLLAGRTHAARIAADRELRRRGLELLPTPAAGAPSPRPALLALAVLLPLDERARASLERVVALTPIAIQEGGFP
jgi:CRISPR-associated protein Csx17